MKARSLILSVAIASGICSGLCAKTLESGDDLYRAIRKAENADTLYLSAGKYVLDGAVSLDKSLTIVGSGDGVSEVEVYLFRIGERMKSVTLKNLDITLTGKYLFDTRSDEGVDAGLICLDGCTVNLGGETGASLVNSRTAGTEVNAIGEIRVSGSVVYNGGQPQHFFFNGGSSSETKVGKFTAENSTFRFIITGNRKADIENSWFTGDYPTFPYSYGMKSLGDAADVFSGPSENPEDGRTSFRIKSRVSDGTVPGDPRWNE